MATDATPYIIGAHYDSVIGTPGADDNASAVPAWYRQRYDNGGAYDWLTGEAAPVEWGDKLYLMESIMWAAVLP